MSGNQRGFYYYKAGSLRNTCHTRPFLYFILSPFLGTAVMTHGFESSASTISHMASREDTTSITPVPTRWVGPFSINSAENGSYLVHAPLATYESPLWPSVERGAALAKRAGGITATIIRDGMARSIVIDAISANQARYIKDTIEKSLTTYIAICEETSRYLKVRLLHCHIVSSLLYIRIEATTGDASGHNMITKAADALLQKVCREFPGVKHISVSGNFCTDKKVSSVNAILGRGKSVVAEVTIPERLCHAYLRASPQSIVDLNIKKNLIGSIISGAVESANAHYANMLLGIYLATGQDVANIVEGSQGITHCEVREGSLYFSVSLPNIIVGTIGNGKDLPFIRDVFEKMGCLPSSFTVQGQASRKLAEIVAATVLAGELSLLGAQANPGELVSTHMTLERREKKC